MKLKTPSLTSDDIRYFQPVASIWWLLVFCFPEYALLRPGLSPRLPTPQNCATTQQTATSTHLDTSLNTTCSNKLANFRRKCFAMQSE
eukprot:5258904-Amphidinium_carterae.1